MGRLRYGSDVYELPDTDVAALELATVHAFADAGNTSRGAVFTVEIRNDPRIVALLVTPGVPITFELDDKPSLDAGDVPVERYRATAMRNGAITIRVGPVGG